jgi:hypothetical protein
MCSWIMAAPPDGIDLAWQPKHYLGAPVPGATVATVNFAHVVAAVEFLAEETVEQPGDGAVVVIRVSPPPNIGGQKLLNLRWVIPRA